MSPTLAVFGYTFWSALNPDCLDILPGISPTSSTSTGLVQLRTIPSTGLTYLAWLCGFVEAIRRDESHRRVVVLTLHAPTIEGTSEPKCIGGPMNCAFATEITELTCRGLPVQMWIPIGTATLSRNASEYMPTNVAMALVLQILILVNDSIIKGRRSRVLCANAKGVTQQK